MQHVVMATGRARGLSLIKIRYADLPAGLHVRAAADGRHTIVYLLPGLTRAERRAALLRIRRSAELGHGPRLPAGGVAAAAARDRAAATARNGAAAFRAHPLLLLPPVLIVASATLVYVMLSAVSIRFPAAAPGAPAPARAAPSGTPAQAGAGPSVRFQGGAGRPGGRPGPGAPGTPPGRRAGPSASASPSPDPPVPGRAGIARAGAAVQLGRARPVPDQPAGLAVTVPLAHAEHLPQPRRDRRVPEVIRCPRAGGGGNEAAARARRG
jgi:hypothetical protein